MSPSTHFIANIAMELVLPIPGLAEIKKKRFTYYYAATVWRVLKLMISKLSLPSTKMLVGLQPTSLTFRMSYMLSKSFSPFSVQGLPFGPTLDQCSIAWVGISNPCPQVTNHVWGNPPTFRSETILNVPEGFYSCKSWQDLTKEMSLEKNGEKFVIVSFNILSSDICSVRVTPSTHCLSSVASWFILQFLRAAMILT